MKNLKIALASFFVLVGSAIHAQKNGLSLDDAIMKKKVYYGQKLNNLQWTKSKDLYSYYGSDKSVTIAGLNGKVVKLTAEDINSGLDSENQVKKAPTQITWLSKDVFQFVSEGKVYEYNVKNKSGNVKYVSRTGSENFDFTENGDYAAYTVDNNLYVVSANGEHVVTKDEKSSNIINGQVVHRVEFGITKGTFWSPKGDVLAYYHKDESMVSDYPLVNVMTREAELEAIKYPMAGRKSEEVTLVLYNVETQKEVVVQTGTPKEQYLTNVAWGPNQNYIYIAVLNRDQNHMKLNQYNAENGEFVKTLFEEKSETYVQPLHKMEFIPGKNDEFLWRSERDGYNHFYRYNVDGKLLNQVTSGEWVVDEFIGFDKNKVYFTATDNNGLDRVIYKSNVTNSSSKKLSKVGGVHKASLSPDKKKILDSWSNLETPNTVDLINASNGQVAKQLFQSPNPLVNIEIGKIELGKIKAADGETDLNTRTVYPANFDPSKKYPVLIYVYNGPGVQLIHNRWLAGSAMWMPYFANQGYIIYTVEGRGSENRGVKFEQVTFRHLGDEEMKDQIKGVEHLKGLPYVDGDRIAVHGWSYGGYMTTNLMTSYPDVFNAGVAGGPVIDWKWYEVMYGERYMDTPESNPEGYASTSLLPKAKNLKGKLLMIHGDVDPTVVVQHSMRFVKQCIDDGVQVDYFLYPQHEHNVRGKDRVHLMRKVLDYIEENNKGVKPEADEGNISVLENVE
ncbi:MAG: DPP IV N-terminal domain-containing protein [Bacteroidota bacterium]